VTFWKDRRTSGETDDKQERLRPFGGSREEAGAARAVRAVRAVRAAKR